MRFLGRVILVGQIIAAETDPRFVVNIDKESEKRQNRYGFANPVLLGELTELKPNHDEIKHGYGEEQAVISHLGCQID